ncbi:MAG: Na+/H+ antiporter [Pedobacter sp.]|nr:MAG: Na+/H+ antiporter [Pedobacter sp.]
MLDNVVFLIIIVIIIMALVMIAEKLRVAYPILLVVAGLLISLYPGLPVIRVEPELIFLIFLPPLLFDAAWLTSWKNLWKFRRVVSVFAFLVVIVTSFVVAIISSYLIPGFDMALGFLLGAIVSPPDAVSATSVLKYVKVPKSIAAIIEGESLLNDASSLIIFRFAIIAVNTGKFVIGDATLDFLWVIIMGIVTGVAIGMVYYIVQRWLPTTTEIDTVLTLTAPYVMYIVAEEFQFSGVLAVVSGGLYLSSRKHLFLSHRSRLSGANVWSTLGFLLNGLVFMLIGLELPVITQGLGNVGMSEAIGYSVIITAVLIVTRIACSMGASLFTIFASRYIRTADSNPGWKGPLVFGWAGMRGVVSLAAALSIPLLTDAKEAFPQRHLILFITFVVILLTLVVQGLTLPWLIKWLKISETRKPLLTDGQQEEMVRKELASKSLRYLRHTYDQKLLSSVAINTLIQKLEHDQLPQEDPEMAEKKAFVEIYLDLLDKQRLWLVVISRESEVDEDLIRKQQGLLDLEEEKISVKFRNGQVR